MARNFLTLASRIGRMGPHEVWTRGRQIFGQRRDAFLYRVGVFPPRRFHFGATAGKGLAGQQHLQQTVAELKRRLPEECEALCRRAERICQHRFDLLGYQELDYGPEIDWHLDRVSGIRAPLHPWYELDLANSAEVGDPKVTWELNRHQHLVTLARAYCLTKRPEFAAEAVCQWKHWQIHNPYPLGINWASSLEVGLRSLSWLWLLELLRGAPPLDGSLRSDFVRALALNAYHIERNLSTYSSPNTHLLGEAVALFFIGTLCREPLRASKWRDLGWGVILKELERQVQADGMHFEQSTYYHVYALDFFLHARTLAAANQVRIPDEFDIQLGKMLDVLCALSSGGPPPRLGDDAGGRVFDSVRNRAGHLTEPLATGAVLFGRGEYKQAAGNLCEESLWLLGVEGAAAFDRLAGETRANHSVAFPASGLYVFNSKTFRGVLDAGKQGFGRAGHGHADALSLALACDGLECLADPGTYTYLDGAEQRDLLRSTLAHNTVVIDDRSQSTPIGRFAWAPLTHSAVGQWVTEERFDFFRACHDGYQNSPEPVVHERSVFRFQSDFLAIRDRITGAAVDRLAVNWHA